MAPMSPGSYAGDVETLSLARSQRKAGSSRSHAGGNSGDKKEREVYWVLKEGHLGIRSQ